VPHPPPAKPSEPLTGARTTPLAGGPKTPASVVLRSLWKRGRGVSYRATRSLTASPWDHSRAPGCSPRKPCRHEIVAIDGQALQRAHARKEGESPLRVVSAWAATNGVVLGQVSTDAKSNEIMAIPKLLDLLRLKGCILTIDAMGCQTKIAEKIVESGGDYDLALKGNQNTLVDEVDETFVDAHAKNPLGPLRISCRSPCRGVPNRHLDVIDGNRVPRQVAGRRLRVLIRQVPGRDAGSSPLRDSPGEPVRVQRRHGHQFGRLGGRAAVHQDLIVRTS
jgi:hypothetical protein